MLQETEEQMANHRKTLQKNNRLRKTLINAKPAILQDVDTRLNAYLKSACDIFGFGSAYQSVSK